MARLLNDGSGDAPKLRIYLNLGSIADLRAGSVWPGLDGIAPMNVCWRMDSKVCS